MVVAPPMPRRPRKISALPAVGGFVIAKIRAYLETLVDWQNANGHDPVIDGVSVIVICCHFRL